MKSINEAVSFDEVAEIRQQIYLANLAGNNNFEDILYGLYKDDTHFIYELLQNADDVFATKVGFILKPDELVFYHNGTKDFDLKNVIGITGIGASTKVDELNKIGKFGIGFKSVFSVTETPRVYSGQFNFEIQNFTVPSRIEPLDGNTGTTFVLPFNRTDKPLEDVYNAVKNAIKTIELDPDTIMFLDNIKMIEWESDEFSGSITKRVKVNRADKKIGFYSASGELLSEYLVFSKPLQKDEKLSVSIAYKIVDEKGKETFVPLRNTKLRVYFSTETVTFLNFIVNAPFRTTSTRESVDGTKPHNITILDELAELYRSSLTQLKARGFLNRTSFINELPIIEQHCQSSFVYSKLFEVTVEAFKTDKLIPTASGGYCNTGDAALARGAELTRILSKDDLQLMYKRNNWLSKDITLDRTPAIRTYLMQEHGVPEVDYASFCRSISAEFITKKDDNWMLKFYSENSRRTEVAVIRLLKDKPIIRVENGNNIPAYINNIRNVYLPSPSIPAGKRVKAVFANNADSLNFFNKIGIEKSNAIDGLRTNALPSFNKSSDINAKLECFKLFFKAYCDEEEKGKSDIVNLLKNEQIILLESAATQKLYWGKAEIGYFRTADLNCLFDGCSDVLFVSQKLLDLFPNETERLIEFLRQLGVYGTLKRVHCEVLDYSRRIELQSGGRSTSSTERNYNIHCLRYILDNITEQRSRALFKIMSRQAFEYFRGSYSWWYSHSSSSVDFNANFVDLLNSKAWLYDGAGNFVMPNMMFRKDAMVVYDCKTEIPLLGFLNFVADAVESLPVEVKEKLDLIKDIPYTILIKLKETYENAQSVDIEEQVIEEEPNMSNSGIVEAEFSGVIVPTDEPEVNDDSGDDESTCEPAEDDVDNKQPKKPDESYEIEKKLVIRTADNQRGKIGIWGEHKVIYELKRLYKDKGYTIVETDNGFEASNDEGDSMRLVNRNIPKTQHGHDFELYENDEIVEYIEVKAKTTEDTTFFPISGTQWKKAQELFRAGQGDKYVIYLVSSAGKPSAKVTTFKNPVKNWFESKIYADPVNILL